MRNKILVVDDSLFNRQMLHDILKDKFDLVEACDGQEALDIIEKQKEEILAVLLDIVMPKMDGVTLLKILNEKKYLDSFPVLMVTGENSFEILADCFKYGASDYIRKPVHKDFVIERVEKLTELYLKNNEYITNADVERLCDGIEVRQPFLRNKAIVKNKKDFANQLIKYMVKTGQLEQEGKRYKRVKVR